MTRFLITGGAGFIGSSLADKLSESKANNITIVDNLLTGSIKRLPTKSNIEFINADVNNFEDISGVFSGKSYDYIYHYAAVVGVRRTLNNPISVLEDIQGIKNILNFAKNTGVKRILFASSSEVYGEPVEMPQNESTTPLNSRLPYAVVKNIGESFLKSYKFEYGLDYTIFRFFNTYGPKQSTDFVMSKFIKTALNNDDITIYGNGSQTRTFCYIDDNIEATINSTRARECIDEVINIGNDIETSILDLAKIIVQETKSKSKIIHLPPLKEGDMTKRKPDITKMRKLINRDLISLEKGIRLVIESKYRS